MFFLLHSHEGVARGSASFRVAEHIYIRVKVERCNSEPHIFHNSPTSEKMRSQIAVLIASAIFAVKAQDLSGITPCVLGCVQAAATQNNCAL